MSSSSPPEADAVSQPLLSVVIGSNGGAGTVERCLGALESQRDGAEVLVLEPVETPVEVRERYPWARFEVVAGASVPELWRDGIDRTRGDVVALTISPMLPAANWIETIRAEQREHGVVAGAIEPGRGLRPSDWAEYFCRYARDMLPFQPHQSLDIPGDNCAYRRDLLDRARDTYRDGFWEPVVNRRLADSGEELWQSPRLVVQQGRSAGIRAFARQRVKHGRAHGRKRGARFTPARNLIGVLASPIVPALITVRILREAFARRRHRVAALASLPLIFLFNAAWAAGEAVGHVDALRAPEARAGAGSGA